MPYFKFVKLLIKTFKLGDCLEPNFIERDMQETNRDYERPNGTE